MAAKCSACGGALLTYQSKSSLHADTGKMTICKTCVEKEYRLLLGYYEGNEVRALYQLCMKLDMPFHNEPYNMALTQRNNSDTPLHSLYMQKLNSLREKRNYSNDFMSGERLVETHAEALSPEDFESIEIAYLTNKWGRNIPVEDLKYLEEIYNEWESGYDITGKNRILIVTQICFEELYIYKERPLGQDVSKRLKTITDLMKQGNLSPKQETESESAEFSSFPEFIAKIERDRPCYIENHALIDVDNMELKLKALAGALNRTQGKVDATTAIFDDEFKEFTLDLTNLAKSDRSD